MILTTHSMEEAEALSTKMGIMVSGGELKCFGTAQHIKDKYSSGFIIEMKCRQPERNEHLLGLSATVHEETYSITEAR